MARYIDADVLCKHFKILYEHAQTNGMYNHAKLYDRAFRVVVDAPTADVVPKSEVEKFEIEIEALKIANEKMYAANKEQQAEIDSFLESVDELQADKADVTYFKKQLIANAKSEVAREIFAELDKRLDKVCIVANRETEYNSFIGVVQQVFDAVGVVLSELKKKYTEDA